MLEDMFCEMNREQQDKFVLSIINSEQSESRDSTLQHLEMLYSPESWVKLFSAKISKSSRLSVKQYSDNDVLDMLSRLIKA